MPFRSQAQRRPPIHPPEAVRAILKCLGIPARAPPMSEAAADDGAFTFDPDPWSDSLC
jgi:hypothetical protein